MAQSAPPEPGPFPARVKEVARGLRDHPRLKELTEQEREEAVEFVVGNMLFVLLHELAHTAVADPSKALMRVTTAVVCMGPHACRW